MRAQFGSVIASLLLASLLDPLGLPLLLLHYPLPPPPLLPPVVAADMAVAAARPVDHAAHDPCAHQAGGLVTVDPISRTPRRHARSGVQVTYRFERTTFSTA